VGRVIETSAAAFSNAHVHIGAGRIKVCRAGTVLRRDCIVCKTEEACIHNWQKTEWAQEMMDPVRVEAGGPGVH